MFYSQSLKHQNFNISQSDFMGAVVITSNFALAPGKQDCVWFLEDRCEWETKLKNVIALGYLISVCCGRKYWWSHQKLSKGVNYYVAF